jgi:outer membrane protein assembly factor BamB
MPLRSTFRIAPLVVAFVLSGCKAQTPGEAQASTPPAPRSTGEARSAFPVVHESWAKLGYRLDWVGFPFPAAAGRSRVLSVVPFADLVVAQDSESTVTVLEASTGRVRWSTDLTGPLTKWTGIAREEGDAGRLMVSSESELFQLAIGTGNLLGRERYERVTNTPPLLVGGLAVAGTPTGVVQAHLIGRNVSAWNFGLSGAIEARLLPVGGYISVVSQSGDVVFLTGQGRLVGRAGVLGPLDCDPGTDGTNLYIAGRDQSLWAFDVAGNTLWRYRTSNPLKGRPVVHGGTVYCDLGALGMSALDAASGVVKWHAKGTHGEVVAVRQDRPMVWDGKGVTVLDPARGDVMARVELPGVVRITPDAFTDGNIYAVSDKGVMAKFMVR